MIFDPQHDQHEVQHIAKFTSNTVNHDFYSDIGNITDKVKVKVNDDNISYTVKELIELRYRISKCSIVSPKMIYILLGDLCI